LKQPRNALQHAEVHCPTAMHCNTLQHHIKKSLIALMFRIIIGEIDFIMDPFRMLFRKFIKLPFLRVTTLFKSIEILDLASLFGWRAAFYVHTSATRCSTTQIEALPWIKAPKKSKVPDDSHWQCVQNSEQSSLVPIEAEGHPWPADWKTLPTASTVSPVLYHFCRTCSWCHRICFIPNPAFLTPIRAPPHGVPFFGSE